MKVNGGSHGHAAALRGPGRTGFEEEALSQLEAVKRAALRRAG